jgi:hypothetical protein
MNYYGVRILAAFLFMGSFAAGCLAGAEYGKWIGWTCFIILATAGIVLHFVADKITKRNAEKIQQ